MKKLMILSVVLFTSVIVKAQTTPNNKSTGSSTTAGMARDAACNSYNAEKAAEKSMTPAVKSLYKAAQDPKETRARDAAYTIICNPPKKVDPKGTTRVGN